MTNRVHSEVPAIKIKNMKMNEQQQLQHHHQQRQLVADLMEQQNRRRRRASISSESSVEAMDLARMPNRSAKHNGSSPSSSRSEHIDSDNFESDAEDFSTKYKRQLSQHTNFARGVGEQERRNSRNSSSNSSNGGNIRKKFRSSTPNRGNNNNSTGVSTTTHNSSIASSLPSDRTQNESGFVDVSSSQHLNSSPEPPSATDRDDVKYICPICEVVSATPHEFTNHIRCHNYSSGDTENFTCRICSKVLSSASSLDRHVLVHTGERPFNCKYCHLTFTTNGNMHRHMRTHKQHMQQRNANIAGGGGGVGNGNSNHNNGNNRNVAPPGSGGSGGGTSSGNGDGESDESDGCSTDSSASSSNNNIKYNNNNNNDNHNNYNKRKITDEETTAGTLKRRVKTTINNNIISESELEYTSGGQQKYSCPLCSRSDFADMFTLGSHMDREHPGIPAKCRQCEMVFKSHKSLNAHRCSQQQKINVTQGFKDMTFVDFSSEKFPLIAKSLCEQSIHTPITSQKFECPKCLRAFPCASAVDIHAKDCGDSPAHDYSIRKRGASESSEEEIRRDEFFAHLDLRNKSAMSLASTMSSPRTSEKSDSNVKIDHERNTATSHSGTYNCNESKDLADIQSILNVTSSSNSFLRNFENVVNTPPASDYILGKDEEEAQDAFTSEFRKMKLRGEFPCKLCTAVYPNLRALKGHNRVHLSAAGAGPYRCNMCPYSIHDKAALIRHMRTHNGDRPYECAVCNYAFTTKANCERHLRNRHAKTTREEVKRAIIYHPSEDSSCEDPIKKLQMFSSPEFDEDDHPSAPKDRSTPVSHLKEMLQSTSPIKIQVKSLEKLMDTSNMSVRSTEEKGRSEQDTSTTSIDSTRPIDLSMDVLDLSKKAKIDEPKPVEKPEPKAEDLSTLEKNHQWLLAQQQIFKDSLSQMDPAHYLQLSQLYRNLMFPSIPPFLFPNTFLPNNFGDLNKFPPMLLNPLFPRSAESVSQESAGMRPTSVPQPSSVAAHSPLKGPENPPSSLQLPPSMPQQLTIPRHPLAGAQPPPSMLSQMQNTGPVKMVIKNGVLMPKQKQRRYRTERPFTCEHCAARFTLRSNMERHVKQQHPQFWAQRQRSGHHIMRRGGSVMSQMSATSISPQGAGLPSNHFSAISDQVKYAILAHQLKAPKDSDILQQALTQNKVNLDSNHLSMVNNNIQSNMMGSNGFEDDDPKLIIDEGNEGNDEAEEEEDEDDDIYEESKPEDLSSNVTHSVAKQVAENILEQAKKASSQMVSKNPAGDDDCEPNDHHNMDASNSMLTQAESVGKYLKKVANSSFKEDSSDLVPVSKLVDNATNSMSSFNTYFRPTDMANHMEQSDEEGLVASGSTSESTNSGNEAEPQGSNGPEGKRKSAYSLAPNRVSCNYCQRTFPWTSSLRRHILTHTGQKPFKCSHCPLLFTTKSNCDRHLLRKHGNVESAVSLYVPIADIPDPVPMPRAEEPAEEQLKTHLATANCLNLTVPNLKTMEPLMSSSDLPFKCHLCDSSFAERNQCLDHIKISHSQEFALLLAKGAIDAEAEHNQIHSTEDDERCGEGRGKYPDYANRKVMCAFCMRRFWSTEDLRRHMRTHSGERPFQCEVCLRKFTLKHSMLRHMKKHSNGHNNHQLNHLNSGSDMSEDEQTPPPPPASLFHKNPLLTQKIREALRAEAWRQSNLSGDQKEKIAQSTHSLRLRMEKDAGVSGAVGNEENSDLISDLLGITGQGILNKLLSSPDEAAKLLGVDK